VRDIFEDDHAAFADSFRGFVERESAASDTVTRAGEAGLLGMEIPEKYGGAGVSDPRFCAVAVEELVSAGRVGHALSFACHVGVGVNVLMNFANSEQKTLWLPSLAAGKSTIAVAAEIVSCTGADGGDSIALDGNCQTVFNGGSADVALIPVKVDTEDVARLAVIDLAEPSVRRERVDFLALTEGALAEFTFAGLKVAQSTLLPPTAFAHLRVALRLWTAVIGIAAARVAVDWTCAYVCDRKVFGQPVSAFQNTRQVLGGLSAEITSAQAFIDHCLRSYCANSLTMAAAASVNLICSELLGRAVDQGLQLHGGYGYMREYPISTLFADARLLRWLPEPGESLRLELAEGLKL
jgi:alkylation response protein AidB-like acyl-CoA dehydrogenase